MGGKNCFIVFILVIFAILGGCLNPNYSSDPVYYGCPLAPDGYSDHVKSEWINSPTISNVNDINASTYENLSNDTKDWLDKYSVSIGFTVTRFKDLNPDQQDAFQELRNESVVTGDEERQKLFSSLSPYYDTYENGYISYNDQLYGCEKSWQGT